MHNPTDRLSKITSLTAWLNTMITTADTYFWNALSAEYTMTGTVTDDPFDAATKIVAAAEETMEAILTELNVICDQTGVLAIDATKTLNRTNAPQLVTSMSYTVSALRSLLSSAPIHDGVQVAMKPALTDMFTHAKALLESVGILYPAVFTSFYPVLTGLQVTALGGADTLTLSLSDGTNPVNWPAGAGWEEILAVGGDLLQIATLNAVNAGPYGSVTGNVYEVDSVTTDDLVLTVPGMTTADFDGLGVGVATGLATTPGTQFVLRKIQGA